MRRTAVRSIGVEACLFDQKELEQLYAVFKVCPWVWSMIKTSLHQVKVIKSYCCL